MNTGTVYFFFNLQNVYLGKKTFVLPWTSVEFYRK